MKEVWNIMEQMCKDSIKSVICICALLLPIQNGLALWQHDLDSLYMVVLPFLFIFVLLNMAHTKRCKQMMRGIKSAQKDKAKERSLIISEFLFTSASYALLLAVQYISWIFLYQLLKQSFPIHLNEFYFFTLSNTWLNPIILFQWYDILLMLLAIALLAIQFTFFHISMAVKEDRGLAILFISITCISMVALTLFPRAYLILFIILIALSIFAIVELFDLLHIQRGGS